MKQNNQQLIKASIITVIIAGVLGALSMLAGGIGAASAKLFSISLSLIFFGITATISMIVTRKPEYKGLGTAGIIVSAVAFLLIFIIIVAEIGEQVFFQFAFCFFIASIALAHICLLHYFNLQNKYALYARMTATAAISIFSLSLIVKFFEPFSSLYSLGYNQEVLKLLFAALIVDLGATLLVPLSNQLKTQEPVDLAFTSKEPHTPQALQEEKTTPLP